ncbi:saccharopine dehydrogenase NADP-binding domain-containing protein [Marinobacter xestospongiae]|uniref:Saccharopine dehydrogenase NADP-binding domain-containing protein n=1 Tax=Marinobacter xestospongiae TaxID=994319 RepID=A0ABU3VVS6_9GAMM|nr:saccharopine dehydrogenase NADP-binding domain-containing protein [Marinobacter xestospongiae]MDV2078260.1 saccharopine dehydrogenase NADP-binding domain-containing protein [Marinobacter xestospongiae]
MTLRRVLILGGYGNFGKRIAENLSGTAGIVLLIAGRNADRAEALCRQLAARGSPATLEPAVLDINRASFVDDLRAFAPDLVIHTGGPFQGQDYRVPQACIAIGSHYIDLADDRRFVCDIDSLDDQARARDVLVVAGASSVPGLSSAVIDHFTDQFSALERIDFAIAPGNQAERGEATVHGILSYTGHPFPVFDDGEWRNQYGWMAPRKQDFGPTIGRRWLANINIPDLELFPERYRPVKTVHFQAGLELPVLHLGMVMMAWLAKVGLVRDWSAYTRPIVRASEWFIRRGTDTGGMQINLSGRNHSGQTRHINWLLCAENGEGPYIPTISTIILARKLIAGSLTTRGATPCLGLYSLAEFDQEIRSLAIHHRTEVTDG